MPVRKVKTRVYMISGVCAAMAGLIIASELTSAAPQAGETFELNAIAAVVIGGTSLAGGRGNVRGALIGAFVIGFLADGLVILGVSTFWQMVIKGAVIILAVILDQAQQRIQRRGAAVAARRRGRPSGPPAARGLSASPSAITPGGGSTSWFHPMRGRRRGPRRSPRCSALVVAGCGSDDDVEHGRRAPPSRRRQRPAA